MVYIHLSKSSEARNNYELGELCREESRQGKASWFAAVLSESRIANRNSTGLLLGGIMKEEAGPLQGVYVSP